MTLDAEAKTTPTESWIQTHTKNYLAVYPERGAEGAAKASALSASCFSRASAGYSKDGAALKATCKDLGIKHTYKAIFEFFGAVPAPRAPKAPTMSKEEALARAQNGRADKILTTKLIRSSRYGAVMPMKQFVRALVEEGAVVLQTSCYKRKKGAETELVEGLRLGDSFWSAHIITTTGIKYAKRILQGA